MPKKVFNAQYKDTEIQVVNTWFGGCRLYIDGEEKDLCTEFFSVTGAKPCLSTVIESDGEEVLIEAFARAILSVKFKICANGEFIGGNEF
jgi:hypothetical protein